MITQLSTDNQLDLEPNRGQQFLQFRLLPDTDVLLPLTEMIEILSIPTAQIVPIPQLPKWVMGIYNWQGQILWLVDLGQLIGLSPIYEQATSNYTVVVTGHQGVEIGLLVHRVEDIEWVDPDSIESPPESEANTELLPFLRGFIFNSRDQLLVVLDSAAIFAAMPQNQKDRDN